MLTKAELRTKCTQTGRRYRLVTLSDESQVRIQSLTRAEQRAWRKATQKKDGTIDPKTIEYSNDVLMAMVIVDESGALAFTISDALNGMFDQLDTADTTLLVDAAVDHCGLVVDAKELDDAKKNSEGTPGNSSSGANENGSA